jgi:adenylate cyclase
MTSPKDQLTAEEQIFLEQQLTKEIIENERKRALILGVISFLFLLFSVGITLFYNEVLSEGNSLIPFYFSSGMLVILIWRAFIMRKMLQTDRVKKIIHDPLHGSLLRYFWLFFEVSFPTAILIFYSNYFPVDLMISTPIIWFYFIIIIASVLSLDFYMSLFCGFTSALQYLFVVFLLLGSFKGNGFGENISHFIRSVILFASGGIAGVAAYQLKKRIYNTYISLLERNRIINLFDQQVSKEIVEELLNNYNHLGSKKKFVCIMFLDIRDFTPFAEKRSPEEIIDYQNNIFSFMIGIITKHNGIINQFLGDGYMATFGAPITKGNDCENAFNAALEIIETVNLKSKLGEIPETKIGIGLHAGDVVAGNVGTAIRKQYSISGNTVILASRIEGLTKKHSAQLLVSEEVLDNANINKNEFEFLGHVNLKGRETPIDIYKIL